MPSVLDAAIALLESVPPAADAARPERYEIQHPIGAGGHYSHVDAGEKAIAVGKVIELVTKKAESTSKTSQRGLERACLKRRPKRRLQAAEILEVPPRFELGNGGFADHCLTAWLWHRVPTF